MSAKQVDASHYALAGYMTKARWISLWHQLDEVRRLAPGSVLELGPGPGLFKFLAARFGIRVHTVDVDPDLAPDLVASATELPVADAEYSVVCAFQTLEHLPYEDALRAFGEMVRVSRRHVLISLPDSTPVWRYLAHIPRLGPRELLLPRPRWRAPEHRFDGEHHWEIGKRGFSLAKVSGDLSLGASLRKTYRVSENPYHRFFLFEKCSTPSGTSRSGGAPGGCAP